MSLTRSERYLLIKSASVLTTEACGCCGRGHAGRRVRGGGPTRHGVDYGVEDAGDQFLVLHNDGAENKIATAPVTDPTAWTPLVPHRAEVRLLDVDAFADFIVVYFRRDGLTGLRILRRDGTGEHEIAFPEPVYRVGPGLNPEFAASRFRLSYTSLVTPGSVYGLDVATGELTLLKRQPVLPSPGRRGVPARGLRAVPGVGGSSRRHPRPDLAGVPPGHPPRRHRALPVRLREL